jgi:hypothetical protein
MKPALRITPAMHLGVTDHVWTIGELVATALDGTIPEPRGRRHGRFTVVAQTEGKLRFARVGIPKRIKGMAELKELFAARWV